MSLFDKIKTKKKMSVRQFIGAASIEDSCLVHYSNEKMAFLIITPDNLSILPSSEIHGKIKHLIAVLNEIGPCDFICLNSSQSYEHNKHYLVSLRDSERNKVLRELDQDDIQFLDNIQIQMATSRQFLMALRFSPRDSLENVDYSLNKALQILKDNQFSATIASHKDIKRCLAINLEQDIYANTEQDYDGENYQTILEMSK